MASTKKITRKVYASPNQATRPVPPVVTEWCEWFDSEIDVAFGAVDTDWKFSVIFPDGDAQHARGGWVKPSDAQLQRLQIDLISSVFVDFGTTDPHEDIRGSLLALAAELVEMADSIVVQDEEHDDE